MRQGETNDFGRRIGNTINLPSPGEDYGYVPQGMLTETQCQGATVCGYLHMCSASDTLLIFFR